LGLTLHLAEARAPAELEEAFARLAAAHVGAFIVQQDALFGTNRALVIKLATQHRLPSMSVVWVGSSLVMPPRHAWAGLSTKS
jgi:predicted HAD superfamily phosphohydrolase